MYFSVPVLAALLQVAFFAPNVEAHCRVKNIVGNADPSRAVPAYGHIANVAMNGKADLYPYQYDVTGFGNPLIPGRAAGARFWMKQGCGSTLSKLDSYYLKTDPSYAGKSWWDKNWGYFQNFIPNSMEGYIQQVQETTSLAKQNKIPRATQGGWLNWQIYTVNADGAGPFRCRVDTTGSGANFGDAWLDIPGKYQVPGEAAKYSVNDWQSGKFGNILVNIPKDLKCTGSYPGHNNVCMMRCENYAQNGPFGGCMAFQLRGPGNTDFDPPKPTPPKPTKKPVPVDDEDDDQVTEEPEPEEETPTPTPTMVKPPTKPPTEKGNVGYNIYGGKPEYRRKAKRDSKAKKNRRAIVDGPTPLTEEEED
ncbi:hypothetical protein ABW20_dc0100185 [Dactylellina cionopaga]|nr:hypothetical protein ABW20_dc0100185 [Dactylellina cionopaga]